MLFSRQILYQLLEFKIQIVRALDKLAKYENPHYVEGLTIFLLFYVPQEQSDKANSQIGLKCDFRDWPRFTFEAVADTMFA